MEEDKESAGDKPVLADMFVRKVLPKLSFY
jgi:hypothetical protein